MDSCFMCSTTMCYHILAKIVVVNTLNGRHVDVNGQFDRILAIGPLDDSITFGQRTDLVSSAK